jgi:hypothetical protein
VHVGRLETGPQTAAVSEWGTKRLERASPTAVHREGSLYCAARWILGWGPAWACWWDTYMETRHRAADGQPKINGGHATGAC